MAHAIRIHAFGGPEVLQWEEMAVPQPAPGEILLRHTAVGLNYVEIMQRRGRLGDALPFTPGREGAGIVEAVGDGVTELKTGDRVRVDGDKGVVTRLTSS